MANKKCVALDDISYRQIIEAISNGFTYQADGKENKQSKNIYSSNRYIQFYMYLFSNKWNRQEQQTIQHRRKGGTETAINSS